MPFLSASFCRGLHFPVQKHLGNSLHRCACSPLRTQGPALSLVLGVAGFNSRAGLVRFPHVQANYKSSHGGCRRRLRGCAALHACTHACTSPAPTHMPVPSSSLTMNLRVLVWRPGRVWQMPFLRASFWQGLSLARVNLRAQFSVSVASCHMWCMPCVSTKVG